MCKRILLVVVVVCLGFLAIVGTVKAAVNVQNWADLVYRSSPNMVTAFTYLRTDSAVLRVMYGPNMRMTKSLRNDVSGVYDDYMVKVNRGDTVSIILEAWNDVASGDSTAHHIVLYDTFALIPFYQYGDSGCFVGPWTGIPGEGNSFTYVTNSESPTTGGTYTAPTKIAYYDYTDGKWEGTAGAEVTITDPYDADWINYAADWEDQVNGAPGNSAYITGIAWYWTSVYSAIADDGNTIPYAVKVEFQIRKNNN